jgi:LysR family transcriptional regulator, glycine cleavage system transcriptional activator
VCAPRLLPEGKPLTDPADLGELPLIQKGVDPPGEWSWEFWFKTLGLKRAFWRGPLLRDIGLCLTSAVEGGGVALGRSLLIADAVADGRLVQALMATPHVSSSKVHVARWRPELTGDRAIRILVNWLSRETSATATAPPPGQDARNAKL